MIWQRLRVLQSPPMKDMGSVMPNGYSEQASPTQLKSLLSIALLCSHSSEYSSAILRENLLSWITWIYCPPMISVQSSACCRMKEDKAYKCMTGTLNAGPSWHLDTFFADKSDFGSSSSTDRVESTTSRIQIDPSPWNSRELGRRCAIRVRSAHDSVRVNHRNGLVRALVLVCSLHHCADISDLRLSGIEVSVSVHAQL